MFGIKSKAIKPHVINVAGFGVGRYAAVMADKALDKVISVGAKEVEGLTGFNLTQKQANLAKAGIFLLGGVSILAGGSKMKAGDAKRALNYAAVGFSSAAIDLLAETAGVSQPLSIDGLGLIGEYGGEAEMPYAFDDEIEGIENEIVLEGDEIEDEFVLEGDEIEEFVIAA